MARTSSAHIAWLIPTSASRLSILLALAAASLLTVPYAEARIIRIEITSTESPTFGSTAFGSVGPYEKLRGKAHGEVDPADPRNALITDIELAPRNARGMVEYSMDIYILKPVDLRKGNHKLFVEINNRGNKLFGSFNNSRGGNNPTTAADADGAFLMNQGYTVVWNGWDISAARGNDRLTITVPVATNSNGAAVTGPSYEYIAFDNNKTLTSTLEYSAATLDKSTAALTVRQHWTDPRTSIPSTGWEYVDDRTIRLLPAGTPFQQAAIYEFTHTAKNPLVGGLGLAATRDFVSFLRHAGSPNPLAGDIQYTYAFAISQPARYMNDFQTLGFNEDESGRRVFDGIENWLGGGSGVAINFRFAQTSRTERNRRDHLYPEANFPFAYPPLTDPLSGKTAGRSVRCAARGTCPKALEVNSANEYWVKASSLLHTDLEGNDLPDPQNVRFYLLAGIEHTVSGADGSSRGVCQQLMNPTDPNPALRALFLALDEWVTRNIEPPKSQVPRQSDKTAVFSMPQPSGLGVVPRERLGFPDIPGVTYTGVATVRHRFDLGPVFDEGILTINPPDFSGPVYPSFVSRVDRDGNEVAGIRLPPVAAPIATTTGWALRRAEFGGNDGCEAAGQIIPFKATAKERMAARDPRRSLEERYNDHDGYVAEVTRAARMLEKQRLLLPADVQRYIEEARASTVLR